MGITNQSSWPVSAPARALRQPACASCPGPLTSHFLHEPPASPTWSPSPIWPLRLLLTPQTPTALQPHASWPVLKCATHTPDPAAASVQTASPDVCMPAPAIQVSAHGSPQQKAQPCPLSLTLTHTIAVSVACLLSAHGCTPSAQCSVLGKHPLSK